MIVTATELKINGLRSLFRFFIRIGAIRRQLGGAPGLLCVRLRGFRTLTGWESHQAMKDFRNSGAHLDAMKNLASIGKAKSITWEAQQLPTWAEAVKRLKTVEY